MSVVIGRYDYDDTPVGWGELYGQSSSDVSAVKNYETEPASCLASGYIEIGNAVVTVCHEC